jgi:hypothetical protein
MASLCLVLEMTVGSGQDADCNGNDIDDAVEVEAGMVSDCNGNGVPDSCEVSPSPLSFAAAASYPSSRARFAASLVVTDLDEDGIPDAAMPDSSWDAVLIRWGLGDGRLSGESEIPASSPRSLVAADLDGDGDQDLVAGGASFIVATAFLNTGRRAFQASEDHPLGLDWYPESMASGDFDDDGSVDVVFAGASQVSVLRGRGDGRFEEPVIHALPGEAAVRVVAGKLDGDSLDDIAVAMSNGGPVAILLSRGGGEFTGANPAPAPLQAHDLELGDLDGDGNMDLVAASSLYGRLTVNLGTGDGAFSAARDIPAGRAPHAVEIAALDDDGRRDLLVATPGSILTFLGDVAGGFRPGSSFTSLSDPLEIETADLDQNGTLDVIAGSMNGTMLAIRNGPGRGFKAAHLLPAGDQPLSVAAADFTGDGLVDLLAGDAGASSVTFMQGLGGGTFGDPLGSQTGHVTSQVTPADINGDRILDLVAAGNGAFSTLLGRGDGTFLEDFTMLRQDFGTLGFHDVLDLDGDAVPDIAAPSQRRGEVGVFKLTKDGAILEPRMFASAAEAILVRIGDVDADGLPDLVVGGLYLHVHLGLGSGRFRDGGEVPLADFDALRNLELADLDADGDLEIVAVMYGGIALFSRSAEGTFSQQAFLSNGRGSSTLEVSDLDGDGILDMHAVLTEREHVAMLRGRADGTFLEPVGFHVGFQPWDLALADLDGDGRSDAAAARAPYHLTPQFRGLAVLLNETVPPSSPDCNHNGTPDVCDLSGGSSADIDRDGIPDECLPDCDGDRIPDAHAARSGIVPDVDLDGRPDACERDCDGNGVPDDHQIDSGDSTDVDRNLVPDACQPDCDQDLVPDGYAIDIGSVLDLDGNGSPDPCDPDCNRNSVPDDEDLRRHDSLDANRNRLPDDCDIASGTSKDMNQNGVPDEAEADCDEDGLPDLTEILQGRKPDRNSNFRIDSCDIAQGRSRDVDSDGVPDEVQPDCNRNMVPDAYELSTGQAEDCDGDGRPNDCDLIAGRFALGFPRREDMPVPGRVDVGDLDGDGLEDIVVRTSRGSAFLEILLNGGRGRFERVETIELEQSLQSLVIVDLDRDRIADIAGLEAGRDLFGDYWASVFIGRGDGTFLEPGRYRVGEFSELMIAADADGDRRVDLLVPDPVSGGLTFLRGRGDGSLTEGLTIPAGGYSSGLATGDVDGNLTLDLVTSDEWERAVRVLRGDGKGGFEAPVASPLLTSPTQVALADFNADGTLDVAALVIESVGSKPRGISLLVGTGDGTFVESHAVRVPFPLESFQAVDLDRDAQVDLVLVSAEPGTISILPGRGGFEFEPARHFFAGNGTLSAAVLDLDARGPLDIVTANVWAEDLAFITSESPGVLGAPQFIPVNSRAVEVAAGADMNGDGRTDLVTVKGVSSPGFPEVFLGSLEILFGGEGNSFVPGGVIPTDPPSAVAAGDLDGDGTVDLAIATTRRNLGTVLIGNGDGTFGPPRTLPIGGQQVGIAIGDFNLDGDPDLLVMSSRILILRGNGDGTFEAPLIAIPDLIGEEVFGVEDLDADGILDLVFAPSSPSALHVLHGIGDGRFAEFQVIELEVPAEGLAVGDFDRDLALDLAVSSGDTNTVGLLLAKGDGRFDWPLIHPVAGRRPVSIAALDIDRDGLTNLITGDFSNGDFAGGLSLLLGTGDGRLKAPEAIATGRGPGFVTPVDLDGDGDAHDLAVATREPAGLLLFHNRTEAAPEADCDGNTVSDRCDLASGAAHDCDLNGVPDACDLAAGTRLDRDRNGTPDACQPGGCQIPGDCSQDGRLDVADALCVLGHLFLGQPESLPCGSGERSDPATRALLDWDPNERIDVSDAIALLSHLFLGGRPHPRAAPGEESTGCVPLEGCPALPGVRDHAR